MRSNLRLKYDIDGSQAGDCFTHYVGFPCALLQEYNELKQRIPAPKHYVWEVKSMMD